MARPYNDRQNKVHDKVCIIQELPWVPWESHGNVNRRLVSREWEWERLDGNGRD